MDEQKEFVLTALYTIQYALTNRKITMGDFLDVMTAVRQSIRVLEHNTIPIQKNKIRRNK